ncbi:response regulator [Paenibacillus sp. CF384]|uniref:response regulator n=1 Tax=Paenibacillus sp. CF384 TaxID=1884382 RepID=UPI0008978182|nr:response regulator [Paenibacillus sp. CF384]SDX56278.1 Response regulator receiver domain-containing protein [Paenibacillus sp. CF384]
MKAIWDIDEKQGFQIVGEAADGESGVRLYDELRPDITIVDINMPGMNGIDVVKRIHQIHSSAVMIMCSARSQVLNVLESLSAGAKGFIAKPFMAEDLVEELFHSERQHNSDTITALLADGYNRNVRIKVKQNKINDLLQLCASVQPLLQQDIERLWSELAEYENVEEDDFIYSEMR